MTIGNSTLVTNLNANYLQGNLASAFYVSGGALGTPSSGNLANCSFPTLNQNTTGNAATATYATSAGSASYASSAGSASYASSAGSATYADYLGGYSGSEYGRIFAGNPGYGTAYAAGSGMNIVTGSGLVGTYNFYGSGNTLTLQAVSDKRLKDNVQDEAFGLDFVKKLRPVTFNRNDIPQTTKFHGFLADDVQLLVTDTNDSLNQTHENGIKSLDYIGLISVLTKAIQELTAKVEALETKLKA
jgi:hypothetical protein